MGKGEGLSGTCIKDTWTGLKGVRMECGKWGWLRQEGVVGEQLYFNNNKKV